jgi:hypothetical protein
MAVLPFLLYLTGAVLALLDGLGVTHGLIPWALAAIALGLAAASVPIVHRQP